MNSSYEHLITPYLVDSRLKLHLLLHYVLHPGLRISAPALSERLRENPWAVAEALNELAEAGLLARTGADGTPIFLLGAQLEHGSALSRLFDAFNDPFVRDQMYARVRDAQQERQFSSWLGRLAGAGLVGLVLG